MKPLPLFDDAAPLAGGAGVDELNSTDNPTEAMRRRTPPARNPAPKETSRLAAALIADHAPTQRAELLAALESEGPWGATDAELSAATGMPGNSARPRRGELVKEGRVADSGRRRKTPSGRMATVWVGVAHANRAGGS